VNIGEFFTMKKLLWIVAGACICVLCMVFFRGDSRPRFLSKHAFDISCGIPTLGHKFVVHRSLDRKMRNLAHALIDSRKTQTLPKQTPPHIIHQIWTSQNEIPDALVRASHSIQQSNPDYGYALWRPAAYEPLLDATHGTKWRQLPNAIIRDLAAAAILEQHGGIVLDIEMECVGSFSSLLSHADCVIGFEPPRKKTCYKRKLFLSPACIAATPHHPIIQAWEKEMWDRSQRNETLDPLWVTQEALCCAVANTKAENLLLVGPTYFCPISPQHIEEFHNILDRTVRRSMVKKIAQTLHLASVPIYSTIAQETLCVHMLGGRLAKASTTDSFVSS
jgi:hypothetical protein